MGEHVIRLSDIGDGIAEAEIAEWLIAVGDDVAADDTVCALMTDKVTIEIPAPVSGKVIWLGGQPGDMLKVGSDLIRLTVEGAGNTYVHEPELPPPPRAGGEPPPTPQMPAVPADQAFNGDLPAAGRRKTAARSQEGAQRMQQFVVIDEVDVTAIEDLRDQMNANPDQAHLTFVPFLIRAMVRALGEQPDLNARLDEDSGILHRSPAVHVGVSVQTPRGAMVPVIRDACGLSLRKTAAALSRLTNAARDGSIRPDEISGSTITIRSLGHPDALLATPVLHRPEVAAIGVNRIVTRPLWDGRAFVPRKVMNLSCSFDHRAVTDGDAAAFVARLRQLLETPALIFIGE